MAPAKKKARKPARPGGRFSKAKPGPGRPKGVPNKITIDVRVAVAQLAQRNIRKLEGWLTRTARKDPGRAADIFLRAIEYHIPKLSRTELITPPDQPLELRHTYGSPELLKTFYAASEEALARSALPPGGADLGPDQPPRH